MTEEQIDKVREPAFVIEGLPARYDVVARYTDVLVTQPKEMTDELRAALAAELTPAEIVELTLTVALATAFSKAAIAWGPPAEMPILEVPTPTVDGTVA